MRENGRKRENERCCTGAHAHVLGHNGIEIKSRSRRSRWQIAENRGSWKRERERKKGGEEAKKNRETKNVAKMYSNREINRRKNKQKWKWTCPLFFPPFCVLYNVHAYLHCIINNPTRAFIPFVSDCRFFSTRALCFGSILNFAY